MKLWQCVYLLLCVYLRKNSLLRPMIFTTEESGLFSEASVTLINKVEGEGYRGQEEELDNKNNLSQI